MSKNAALEALRHKSSDLRALGEIRLVALQDGPGRGQRLLLCRNAAGLECEIALDRGCDIPSLRWRGINLGWNGPVGASAVPVPDAEQGFGNLRGIDGFLVTCGLDHFGMPASGSAEAFIYPRRDQLRWPMHGRVSGLGATLCSYGLNSDVDRPFLWCEAEVRQAELFGEVLLLRRRIEIPLFEPQLVLEDRVLNAGFRATRHGILYHCNLGFPLLDECAELTGSFAPSLLAAFRDSPPIPAPDTRERFDVQESQAGEQGWSSVGLRNRHLQGGIALQVDYPATLLPQLGLWQAWQSGIYALGIEPHTALAPLQAGEERRYTLRFTIEA